MVSGSERWWHKKVIKLLQSKVSSGGNNERMSNEWQRKGVRANVFVYAYSVYEYYSYTYTS